MDILFSAQPFADGRNLADFFQAVAADPDLNELDIVVAWAKRSGLSRLRTHLETIRARSGQARLIAGIDEGGATRQGLTMARDMFDDVHIFHDRSGRTFHPKVYVAWGSTTARLLVGSHNTTAGGTYFNYEAGLECVLALPDDAPLLDAIRDYIKRLRSDSSVCKELTDSLLAELLTNPRYRVGDEDSRQPAPTTPETPEDLDAAVDVATAPEPPGAAPSVFGPSNEPKRKDPGIGRTAGQAGGGRAGGPKRASSGVGGPTGPGAVLSGLPVDRRWFKRLSGSDAQHPPASGSNVTGVLRLVQGGHPIDQTNYFRHDFFAHLPWAATPKPRGVLEQTVVPFLVILNGVDQGVHNLRVDDAAYREAGQGNHTSVLHWDDLGPTLAADDYTGYFVVLERLADDSYRLEITPNDPGLAAFLG